MYQCCRLLQPPTSWVTANEQYQYCTDLCVLHKLLGRMLMAMPGAAPRFGLAKNRCPLLSCSF